MPLPQDNSGGRACVFLAIAILSLGLIDESLGQMMSSPKAPLTPPKKTEGQAGGGGGNVEGAGTAAFAQTSYWSPNCRMNRSLKVASQTIAGSNNTVLM